jgi:hypothetical protein
VGNAAKFGQGQAFKLKWIAKSATGHLTRLVSFYDRLLVVFLSKHESLPACTQVSSIVDQTQLDLKQIESTGTHSDAQLIKNLKKRNLITSQYAFSTFVFTFD